jgi:hypothetical protein
MEPRWLYGTWDQFEAEGLEQFGHATPLFRDTRDQFLLPQPCLITPGLHPPQWERDLLSSVLTPFKQLREAKLSFNPFIWV